MRAGLPAFVPGATPQRSLLAILARFHERAVTHPLLVLAACLLLAALKSGLWLVPSIDEIMLIAADPARVVLPPDMHWLYSSFLGPWLAHMLGLADHPIQYAAINLAVLIASYLACGYAVLRRHGATATVFFGLMFAAAPVSNPLFNWLGYADVVTFAAMTAVVIGVPAWLAFVLGVILAANHFEQGFVFFGLYVLAIWLSGNLREQWRTLAALAIGLVAGRGLVLAYFQAHDMQLQMTRFTYSIDQGSGRMMRLAANFLSNPLVLVWSLFSGLWLYVWQLLDSEVDPAVRRAAIVVFVLCALPVVLVADATRLFALLSWPILLFTLLRSVGTWSARKRDAVFATLATAAFVPQLMVWDGWIYSSATLHSVRYAKAYLVDGDHTVTRERVRKAFVNNSARWNLDSSTTGRCAGTSASHECESEADTRLAGHNVSPANR